MPNIGITYIEKHAAQINFVGHSYVYDSAPNPDYESFSEDRFFDSYNLSAGLNPGEYNGTTADGSITRTETVVAGEIPDPQQ